ncbi:adenosylcobinamide amidohydrolase, partial [Porphyromonas loveana]|uniref:adenosylcobinamide amidohydrolase n=1 Tax=Porphyromonas loveana TaxID=1884669 RepID=UPI0035A0E291
MSAPIPELGQLQPLFFSPMGDPIYHYGESMIVRFVGHRGVVSTSNLNGGYREDLQYAFNNSCGRHPDVVAKRSTGMRGKTMTEHYAALAEDLGLPLAVTTGMGTAALIENTAISTREYHGVTVMAVTTAGIDVNGGRAGEPAAYDEFTQTDLIKPGTINVFLFIDALLDAGALTRAIVTATEAKTAALQELMANSRYSEDLATGSGTDSMIAVCNRASETVLYNSGKHVLLGEMIGQTVKESVKEALAKQTAMTPLRQASIEWQTKRYEITKEAIITRCLELYPSLQKEALEEEMMQMDRDQNLLATVAAIAHLCD